MEPTRIEIDLPTVILNRYGNMELPNHKNLAEMLASYFEKGSVLTLHMVVESEGETRGFCDFVDQSSTYKHECGMTLGADGTCWLEESHEKSRVKQLTLEEAV